MPQETHNGTPKHRAVIFGQEVAQLERVSRDRERERERLIRAMAKAHLKHVVT